MPDKNKTRSPAPATAVEPAPKSEPDYAAMRARTIAELQALPAQPPVPLEHALEAIDAAFARIPDAERTAIKAAACAAFIPGTLAEQLNKTMWDDFIAEDALARPSTRTLQ